MLDLPKRRCMDILYLWRIVAVHWPSFGGCVFGFLVAFFVDFGFGLFVCFFVCLFSFVSCFGVFVSLLFFSLFLYVFLVCITLMRCMLFELVLASVCCGCCGGPSISLTCTSNFI
ncbi:hypothetical protein U1Q18_037713 [Sarracenia purpurea var. burkii]